MSDYNNKSRATGYSNDRFLMGWIIKTPVFYLPKIMEIFNHKAHQTDPLSKDVDI